MTHARIRRGLAVLTSFCYPQDISCPLCGQPYLQAEEHLLCRDCQALLLSSGLPPEDQPYFLEAELPHSFAAFLHQAAARKLVHQLKYGSNHWAALPLAEGMAKVFALAAHESLRQVDLVAPVPVHPKRLRQRGYNQAEVLVRQFAFHTGLPLVPQLLRRIHHAPSQVSSSRAARQRNLLGAFEVADIQAAYGQRILLIDDVCTTGATALACAHVLKACGAKDVVLFTASKA